MVFRKLIILLFSLILLSCGTTSRIKLYKYDSSRGLFVRDSKNKDVLRTDKAHGYYCISPQDLERLAEEVIARKNKCEK